MDWLRSRWHIRRLRRSSNPDVLKRSVEALGDLGFSDAIPDISKNLFSLYMPEQYPTQLRDDVGYSALKKLRAKNIHNKYLEIFNFRQEKYRHAIDMLCELMNGETKDNISAYSVDSLIQILSYFADILVKTKDNRTDLILTTLFRLILRSIPAADQFGHGFRFKEKEKLDEILLLLRESMSDEEMLSFLVKEKSLLLYPAKKEEGVWEVVDVYVDGDLDKEHEGETKHVQHSKTVYSHVHRYLEQQIRSINVSVG